MATSTTILFVALLYIIQCFAADNHFKDGDQVMFSTYFNIMNVQLLIDTAEIIYKFKDLGK